MKKVISFLIIITLATAIGFAPVTVNAGEKGPYTKAITSAFC